VYITKSENFPNIIDDESMTATRFCFTEHVPSCRL
jgi:hypothetical protein